MKSLLTFFLLFVIVYYLLKAMSRLFKVFITPDNNDENRKSKKNEGNVTIDYQEKQKKHFDKNKGEYIDYEEIK